MAVGRLLRFAQCVRRLLASAILILVSYGLWAGAGRGSSKYRIKGPKN